MSKNKPRSRPGANRSLPLAFAVALIATIPYLNGLDNGFTFDDVPLVAENPRIRSVAELRLAFTTDWWDGKRPWSLAYRPLTKASFAIDYAVARRGEPDRSPARLPARSAFAFHVQNVLWHGAASAALLLLVLELFASPGLAVATAALFAVHPVHTEAVDGIVGRAELMSGTFAFLALLAAWRVVRDDPPGLMRPALAAVMTFLALLSKETAIVIPAVPLVWLLLRGRKERRALLLRPSFRRLLAFLAVAALAYLAMRAAVLGSPVAAFPVERGTIAVDNPIAGAESAGRLLTPVRLFGHALGLLVYPKTLSADYSYDQIPVVTSPDVATLLSGLALAGLALSAFALRVRAPAASFGVFLFLLSWTLTSNLPIIIGTIFGERLLYLPSAGACLAVASGLIAAGRRVPGRGFATVAITALAVAGGARTWARNPDWNDNLTLFAAAATASPRSCKALDGYASELFTAGRPREAIAWAERALAIYPSYPGAHKTLGKSLRVMANEEGDPAKRRALRERASEHVRTVIALYASSLGGGSGLADAWNLSASLALDRGDTDAALEDFGKSLEVDPAYVPSINGSGVVWAMRADREIDPRRRDDARQAASKLFEHALALDPGNAEALQNAAAMLRELASSSEDEGTRADLLRRAETHETQAFAARRDTGDAAALANLHGLRATQLLGEKRFPEALAEFREAARLEPQAARAYLGIGTVLAAEAEDERIATRRLALVDEAIRSFERALALEPDNPDAHLNLGITYLRQRHDPAKVVEHFRAYLRLVPGTPQRARMEETIRQMDAARDR